MSNATSPVSGQLTNGTTYTVWADARDTVACLQVWAAAGTADEAPGESGIAHMLEHMMFRGTEAVPDGQFDEIAEGLGMYVNAATWLDYTFYTATGPSNAIPQMIALEADRFAALSVAPEAFTPERDVVANERRQVVESVPESLLSEAFHSVLFSGTPYAAPTIGTAEDIAAYTADRVRDFHRTNYAPSRLHVVVVGNVDADEIVAEITDKFGAIATFEAPRASAHGPQAVAKREQVKLAVAAPRVLIGWPAPARNDDDYAAWVVLDELAAAAESSRLTSELEYRQRLVMDISSVFYALRERSALELSLTLRRGIDPDRAIDTVMTELRKLADGPIDDDEMAGAVARVRTARAAELMETAGRAEALGESWVLSGNPLAGFDLDAQVAAVTAADVQRAARSLVDTVPVIFVGVPA